jgi:CheY-like chemotaxis protein
MKRVLVVDDDTAVLAATARMLRLNGYEVTTLADPITALRKIREGQRFDVIVSDLQMPDMHGDELCVRVRAITLIPFILQSGDSVVVERARACGAQRSFIKGTPHPAEFLAAVGDLAAESATIKR